jgi:hypothetical protein
MKIKENNTKSTQDITRLAPLFQSPEYFVAEK